MVQPEPEPELEKKPEPEQEIFRLPSGFGSGSELISVNAPKNEMPFELRRGRSLFTLPDPIKSAGEAAAPATVSLGGVF